MNLLLIAPKIGDIYIDILNELKKIGIDADYIEDSIYARDPRNIRIKKWYSNLRFNRNHCDKYFRNFWETCLAKNNYSKAYDFLLVIDGFRLHRVLFDELKRRNPKIFCVNYLFDSTRSLYHFESNFVFFDKVATFEQYDSMKFNILHLPISWPIMTEQTSIRYKLFGMGVYSPIRFKLFNFIYNIAEEYKFKSYIKLYTPKINRIGLYTIKQMARKFLSLSRHISVSEYTSCYITHELLSGDQFRYYMQSSEVILDTIAFEQDGLTARCMWALGAGKKIITTNKSIKDYDFYSTSQIYVVEQYNEETKKDIVNFLQKETVISSKTKQIILKYRTDNWLKFLLDLETNRSI